MSAANPTKSAAKQKKMQMYSSVGAEERRRANEIAEERKNLDYQAFDGADVTNNFDMTGEVGDTLGQTQPMATTLAGILTDDATPRPDGGRRGKLIKESDDKKRY